MDQQDINSVVYVLTAIERHLAAIRLLLEWRFRDDPAPKSATGGTP